MKRELAGRAGRPRLDRVGGFLAGVLIGLSIWTPVFAASTNQPQDGLTWAILGAVVLLAIGIALKALATKRAQPYHLPRDMRLDVGSPSGEVVNTGSN